MKQTAILIFIYQFSFSQSIDFTSSNLPIVIIDTHDQEIPYDDPRIVADMGIIYNGPNQRNDLDDPHNNYSGKISIEIRGSSSANWAKKSYGIETQQEDGSNRNVSLIDLPPENDWILYASYFDRSLMRNVLSFYLARKMGWYASRHRYCELVLNGEYHGIYILLEKIKRDKNRVNIAKLDSFDTSGEDVTGGYIIKIDKDPWNPGFDSPYPPFPNASQRIRYQYHYPKGEEILSEQSNYIEGFISEFETTMNSENYNNPLSGYKKYINIDAFVDYFILNELSRNVDGYRLSAYFYKDNVSNGGTLNTGPIWDINFSFGNVGYYNSWFTEGWQLVYFSDNDYFHSIDPFSIPFWWKKLFEEEVFRMKIKNRWGELRTTLLLKENIFSRIDSISDTVSEALDRNFTLWGGPGDPYTGGGWIPPIPDDMNVHNYTDEINYLKNWISSRIDWMDLNLGQNTSSSDGIHQPKFKGFELYKNFPNPFNETTIIRYKLPSNSLVKITIYNLQGKIVKEFINSTQSAGEYSVEWNASNIASGIYFYKLTTETGFSQTRKLLLVK